MNVYQYDKWIARYKVLCRLANRREIGPESFLQQVKALTKNMTLAQQASTSEKSPVGLERSA